MKKCILLLLLFVLPTVSAFTPEELRADARILLHYNTTSGDWPDYSDNSFAFSDEATVFSGAASIQIAGAGQTADGTGGMQNTAGSHDINDITEIFIIDINTSAASGDILSQFNFFSGGQDRWHWHWHNLTHHYLRVDTGSDVTTYFGTPGFDKGYVVLGVQRYAANGTVCAFYNNSDSLDCHATGITGQIDMSTDNEPLSLLTRVASGGANAFQLEADVVMYGRWDSVLNSSQIDCINAVYFEQNKTLMSSENCLTVIPPDTTPPAIIQADYLVTSEDPACTAWASDTSANCSITDSTLTLNLTTDEVAWCRIASDDINTKDPKNWTEMGDLANCGVTNSTKHVCTVPASNATTTDNLQYYTYISCRDKITNATSWNEPASGETTSGALYTDYLVINDIYGWVQDPASNYLPNFPVTLEYMNRTLITESVTNSTGEFNFSNVYCRYSPYRVFAFVNGTNESRGDASAPWIYTC